MIVVVVRKMTNWTNTSPSLFHLYFRSGEITKTVLVDNWSNYIILYQLVFWRRESVNRWISKHLTQIVTAKSLSPNSCRHSNPTKVNDLTTAWHSSEKKLCFPTIRFVLKIYFKLLIHSQHTVSLLLYGEVWHNINNALLFIILLQPLQPTYKVFP